MPIRTGVGNHGLVFQQHFPLLRYRTVCPFGVDFFFFSLTRMNPFLWKPAHGWTVCGNHSINLCWQLSFG